MIKVLLGQWQNAQVFVFKILNDSIKKGLKPATDINDFELVDAAYWWKISGSYANITLIRKPEIWHGNPVLGASLDEENPENFEWIKLHRTQNLGGSWGAVIANIGQHHFIPPTHYISTVSSPVYKISEGYSMNESIRGMTTGTTVADFLANIVKKNENQVLKVLSVADGSVLGTDATLSLNDTLKVMSADSVNMTKYILEVTEEGLSSDAVLTSTRYEITIDAEPKSAGDAHTPGSGSITGFEYGTALQTIVNNVTIPAGATMNVISGDGAYVPFKQLNFDTAYVSVTVNADTYFEVLAENGVTTITYQLLPRVSESEAFVLSDLYSVSQANLLIDYVPRGTNVQSFLANLVPSMGASMKLVDKWGLERMDGTVADDDKLVVTSPDGTTTKVYHISKLATQYVRETTYLAYILSNVYTIDQVDYEIHGASGIADISEFYSRIKTAKGATAVVVDVNGAEKTTGHLAGTDMVKVTSADGRITVMYSFATLVSANSLANSDIKIYPNPTKEKLNISGVEPGSRIRIFNSTGKMLNNIEVKHSVETVSLEGFASGVYFVIISNENTITGKHKVVKF
jgi:arginine repressor